jgi:hypothetical protein
MSLSLADFYFVGENGQACCFYRGMLGQLLGVIGCRVSLQDHAIGPQDDAKIVHPAAEPVLKEHFQLLFLLWHVHR